MVGLIMAGTAKLSSIMANRLLNLICFSNTAIGRDFNGFAAAIQFLGFGIQFTLVLMCLALADKLVIQPLSLHLFSPLYWTHRV